MSDWKDDLDKAIESKNGEQFRYAITLPQVARREFYNLTQWLRKEIEELNKKYQAAKGRVDIDSPESGQIKIDKNDWPSYHFTLTLSPDGKQIEIDCTSRRSHSDNRRFRPVTLRLDIDARNELRIFRNGQEIDFAGIAKLIFTPLYSEGSDFE